MYLRSSEQSGLDAAESRRVARPAQLLAGDIGCAPGRTTELLQALRIRKARQCDLAERRRLAIGVARLHDASGGDLDRGQRAGRIAILFQRIETEGDRKSTRLNSSH